MSKPFICRTRDGRVKLYTPVDCFLSIESVKGKVVFRTPDEKVLETDQEFLGELMGYMSDLFFKAGKELEEQKEEG